MQSGHCAKGDACHFAHGDEELRRKEDVSLQKVLSDALFHRILLIKRDICIPIQAASEPTRLASLLKSARSDAALVDLLVVKVLQELPTVGKVKSRRALADHGHDEFVAVGQLSDVDIESLIADVLR